MKTAMLFFFSFSILVMLSVSPFWWKANIHARLETYDFVFVCHMHLPYFNDKLSLAILSQCQPDGRPALQRPTLI